LDDDPGPVRSEPASYSRWTANAAANKVRKSAKKHHKPLTMKTLTCRFSIAAALAACVASLVISCASVQSSKEVSVTLAQMAEPARAAVQKETAGGTVDKITREFEHGKTVYDVEATVGGRHLEYLIDASDGKILGTEVPIEFSQLPEPVRAAADKYFGTTTGLIAMKGVEFGETHYEIEGTRKGKRAEVTFDPSGKQEK